MASIKISLAKTSKMDGTHPLYFILSHGNRTARIATNVSLMPDQWDKKKSQVTNHPQKKQLNLMLSQRKFELEQSLYNIAASRSVRSLTATRLKDILVAAFNNDESDFISIKEIIEKYTSRMDRERTIYNYQSLMKIMIRYDVSIFDKRIEVIDYDWLCDFEKWLTCSTNSKSAYLSRIRAIYNYANKLGYTTAYPFRTFTLKSEKTQKRNMSVENLRTLIFGHYTNKQQLYVEFFALQFLLIGISLVDILNNIRINDGRVEYIRAKTGKHYSIKIQPEMQPLLDKFFCEEDPLRISDGNVNRFQSRYNKALRSIAGITSYWSRHTWATIAQKIDIPKDVVAAALGHGGYSVTDIYIEFDMKKVDEANRKVIDYVWYNKL